MPARWRTIAALVSTALFLLILVVWIRSYYFTDQILHAQPGGATTFMLGSGVVDYNSDTYSVAMPSSFDGWYVRSFMGRRRNATFLGSLVDFRGGYRTGLVRTPAPAPVFTFYFAFPIWPLFVLAAPLPVWFYLHNRGKVRWSLREDIAWMNFRLRRKLRRFAIFSAAGIAAGGLLGWLDNAYDLARNPAEWSLALLVLLPLVDLLIILTRRRIPWRRGLVWMALEIAGFVCFFIATLQESWHVLSGWQVVDANLAPGALALGAVSFVMGAVILALIQLKPQPIKPGPYCPACGYCLIGSPRQICAECGRPFTLDELGITTEDLNPTANFALRV